MFFKDILSKLKLLGDFQIINNVFYLSTLLSKEQLLAEFNEINIKKLRIITSQNYNIINNISCEEWCKNIFLENKKITYEFKNQDYLKKLNRDLDFLLSFKTKEELQAYLIKQIKVGGDNVKAETKAESNADTNE